VGAEGFPVENGRDVVLADAPGEMAAAVLQLLDDPARRDLLGMAARVFAGRYDWRTIITPLNALYADLLRQG
jgi:glycosyltransferase involved in cell wall biosynthesis